MADILRSKNGVYECINNPDNKKRYVLQEIKGCYPVLVPVEDAGCEEKATEIAKRYPIRVLSKEDFSEKTQESQAGLLLRIKRTLRRWWH
ncbi:hypothetical protein [Lacrimispora amygdalina]|nr:hypothetical protein [Clostridium indicum]